ncbi:MAG: glycoside hydrolase family 32 protein [Planctomycetia bacterium]|nr:glycoside hydrolase family 32 protein [Planctomycetia bacterium]
MNKVQNYKKIASGLFCLVCGMSLLCSQTGQAQTPEEKAAQEKAAQDVMTFTQNAPVPPRVVLNTRILREKFLNDPYRPGYHFVVPEDNGMPGDPNGCFYANGRYHLMYLYSRTQGGYCWGHVSSHDLVHWRHHPDAIGPGNGDDGCFSGGAFLDDDGTAWLSYWMLWGEKGIGLAKSSDANYDTWTKSDVNPIIKSTKYGITETVDKDGNKLVYGSADPSNIWKKDGKYYMLTGSLCVLDEYGRKPDSPADQKGDRLYLFESTDLAQWDYQGVFYQRNPEWTDDSEDNMCPEFLPLPSSPEGGPASDKHLLLFISHNKGCQYYVGTYDKKNDRFIPDNHGRMSWIDNTYFAPESLIDGKGRQIMWAWLLDNMGNEHDDMGKEMGRGWSGVYGLPRTLWLGEDGTLRMAPVDELKTLRMNEQEIAATTLEADKPAALQNIVGDSCELELVFDTVTDKKSGIKVRKSPGGEEETLLYYDHENKKLCMDTTRSGSDGRMVLESAPFDLGDEPLTLRVFVDKVVIEVYANNRQAICRRVYPSRNDSLGIELFVEGTGSVTVKGKAWEMMPSNPY